MFCSINIKQNKNKKMVITTTSSAFYTDDDGDTHWFSDCMMTKFYDDDDSDPYLDEEEIDAMCHMLRKWLINQGILEPTEGVGNPEIIKEGGIEFFKITDMEEIDY